MTECNGTLSKDFKVKESNYLLVASPSDIESEKEKEAYFKGLNDGINTIKQILAEENIQLEIE
ncbi:hypothetical protein [Natranaerobius trueperi]|uniref:Uncharacterized protein n=1 Tax=Natranaerobius trueperi TaxID=759412 RepID=A0A226C0E4_9FIRM|nr:hypothetical protein [Natranaerobius trueperi]OWZ84768.1 hypothetical protein CDO51_01745 [Natranaerobius trueperi]